ncbi:MAG: DUF692 domain-containing protein [Immundisolibacterales bacterium]|nr:DUF692 domain-containing protein [Immundisolibacterales bacterium]
MRDGAPARAPAGARESSRPPPDRAGVGLKSEHYRTVLATRPDLGWFEVHPENYMVDGGPPLRFLEAVRADYPLSLHGVGLSLGSCDPPPLDHLARLKRLVERFEPFVVSEHLSWSRFGDRFLADLLPVPMTPEALEVTADNVARTQDHLGRRILIENPSTYLEFGREEIPEPEFLAALVRRTGCGLLLDVNNLFVCASNHAFDPRKWIDSFALEAVEEIHVAGHAVDDADGHPIRVDNHGSPVIEEVWSLYREVIARRGPVPTLIERDANLPPFDELLAEARHADRIAGEAIGIPQEAPARRA